MAAKELITKLKLDSKQFGSKISDANKSVLKFSATFTAIGAAVIAATKLTANYRDETMKAARAAGSTAEEFSALRYAADLSGIGMGELQKALQKVNNPLTEAKKEYQRLGIAMEDVNGNAKTQMQLVEEVADKFKGMGSAAEKSASAVRLFGERGSRMVNLLGGGADKLREMTQEAERMGIVFDERAGEQAELFNDNITRLTTSIKGLIQQTTGAIIEFVNETGILKSLSGVIQSVTGLWQSLDEETREIIVTVGGVVTAVAALTLVITGLVAVIPMIGAALKTLNFNPVILAISLIVVAFATLAIAAVKHWDQIKSAIQPAIDVIKSIGTDLYQNLLKPIVDVFKEISSIISDSIGEIWQDFKDWLGITEDMENEISVLGTVAKVIFAVIGSMVILATQPFKTLFIIIKGIITAIKQIGVGFKAIFAGDMKAALEASQKGQKALDDIATKIKDSFLDSAEKVRNSFKDIVVTVDTNEARKKVKELNTIAQDSGKTVKDEMKKMISKLTSGISSMAGQIGGIMSSVSDLIVESMKRAVTIANRNFDVFMGKFLEAKDLEIEKTEQKEDEKIEKLRQKYDRQLADYQNLENSKISLMETASNERVLVLNEEYNAIKEAQEEEFERWIEQEYIRFEAEKELLLEKALDKEQRQLVDVIMDNDFKMYMENQQLLHDDRMNLLSSTFAAKQKAETTQLAASKTATETIFNAQLEKMTEKKNTSLEEAEISKNEKIKKLEEKSYQDEKKLKKLQILMNWRAEKAQLEQTKGMKITQTTIAGIAGAASAFAMAAGSIPIVGVILGAVLAAAVLAMTFAQVAQISMQRVPAPAGLFLQQGAVLSGPSHSYGGIQAELEGGEGVVDKIRTQKMVDFVDEGTGKSKNLTVVFEAGAIQNYGENIDESFIDKISYAISRRLERNRVYA